MGDWGIRTEVGEEGTEVVEVVTKEVGVKGVEGVEGEGAVETDARGELTGNEAVARAFSLNLEGYKNN